ncbi:hypothetical protein FRB94_014593 [Tulasnella sp. JGI-2019a]|nr:hypothetical protein FRB93_006037 [Tulasnella sp. JGI-2019a]KAG8989201.1 hypothetical protein FRB94_014593 [Tulasnella sp. JGI-2019a]
MSSSQTGETEESKTQEYRPFYSQCEMLSRSCAELYNVGINRADKRRVICNALKQTETALLAVSKTLTNTIGATRQTVHETSRIVYDAMLDLENCLHEYNLGDLRTERSAHTILEMLNSVQEKLVSLDSSPEAGEYPQYRDIDEDIGNIALGSGRPLKATEKRVAARPAKNPCKPWSLLDDLTRLSVEPRPPTFNIVSLLQTLGGDACQAKRNALQLYRIVKRARDICDTINELIILVQISEVEETVVQAAHQYEEMIDDLEGKVFRDNRQPHGHVLTAIPAVLGFFSV